LAPQWRPRNGRRTLTLILAATIAGAALAGGGVASGASGGGTSGGGVTAPKPPKLSGVSCLERCAGLRQVTVGGKIQLSGKALKFVDKVRFRTANGTASVNPASVASRTVEAKVPDGARDAKPKVEDEYGQIAKAPAAIEIVPESSLPAPGSFRLLDASVNSKSFYFYGEGKPTLRYLFKGNGPTDVRIDLVRQKGESVVRSWAEEDVEPNSEQTLEWNGQDEDKKAAENGSYQFRIGGLGDKLSDGGDTAFGYHDHKFPLRAQHTYGDGIGAGRGHQGQDVFAKCGAPIEAARGGKVQFKGYHSRAGNYVVIDGKKSSYDYVYMHLRKKAEVREGENVRTGQRLGENGDTGNASGCHLHFEMWSAPGWYEGGHFISPTKKLKQWDKWS
jgi:murein DD-endopeptidase MepM/ murein hydrolase activator NlpD